MKTIVAPNAPAAIGPYSHAIHAGSFVFCSGQTPLDPKTGKLVPQWHREGSYDAIAEALFNSLKHRRILLEYDSDRAGSFEPLRFVPKDKIVVLGLVSTIYFGWLPLYLPELFPTHARATGAGVSFNFGRILTAVGVLGAGAITAAFNDDYARAGSITTLIYAVGMIVILFAPDTTKRRLED